MPIIMMYKATPMFICRQDRHGGGVSLFISCSTSFVVRLDLNALTDQVEQLLIAIVKAILHVNKMQ